MKEQPIDNSPNRDGQMDTLTPMKACRQRCLDCCGGSVSDVKRCDRTGCALHVYRMGNRASRRLNTPSPLRSIRRRCLDCCKGQANEVRLCPVAGCPLQLYRLGKNPKRAGLGASGAQMASLARNRAVEPTEPSAEA